jgi:hypothetical protein
MKSMKTQNLLDWQRIYNWAAQHESGAVLGESCTNSLCPLAEYLNERAGKFWSVGPSIKREGTDERLEKPAWIKELIEQTDQATGHVRGSVTREQFLDALEKVRE